jgi:outer membrane receptor protein involved in Fe transport
MSGLKGASMIERKPLGLAISIALGLTISMSAPVLAQDDEALYEEELILEEVIVTGTRIISEDGYGRTSPVTVVEMEEIESFGYTRVEEFLNNLPQVEPAQNSMISNGSTGTANVDLRGLGAKRNLVLINGRRMQPGGIMAYAPDINQIPAQLIERVEVLTGGASATYGADAVAGVVNFIMRRVNGVEISGGISGYQHNNSNSYVRGLMDEQGFDYPTGSTGLDGKAYNASIVIGGDFANGRGNATAYATWRENDPLLFAARDYASCALNSRGTACTGSWFATEVPNFFIAPLVEGGWGPYGYDYFQEEFLVLQPDSSLMVDDMWNPSNRYNWAPVNYYMRPDERWSLGAFADYEINEHAVVFLETMATSDRTTAQIAESGTFMAEVYPLHISNDYFPDNFRQSLTEIWPGYEDFGVYIGKRNTEGGARQSITGHSSFRIVAGLRGSISNDWDYDVSYMYAGTSSTRIYVNDFFASSIASAVDSRLCEPDPACIPYEVFTYQGVTREAAANMSGTGVASSSTATTVFQSFVTGTSPWGLPAGNIKAAAGYEHRKIDLERVSDDIFEYGLLLGQGWAMKSLEGGYSVDEVFIETNIPLLADESFARSLTLDLAYRWSDYSTSGPSSTYRVGFDWQVVDWLRFRTGFNHAVRAPNIEELYESQQLGGFPGEDPCQGEDPEYTFEQCARSGVTAEHYGNIPPPPYDDWWPNAIYGGNPELDPEEADTITLGLVFEVGHSMQLSLDYWDVQIEGAIESIEPAIALEQCLQYDRLCDLVHRAPGSGLLWRTEEGYVYGIAWNLGETHARGIDVAWNWSPGVNWQLGLVGSYYLKKEITAISGDADTAFDCAGLARSDDEGWCYATPEWRHIASVTYDSDSFWTVTGRWRYYGDVTYDGTEDQIADKNLADQNYFDLTAVFRFLDTHDVTMGVNNVFDEDPPLVGLSLSNNGNAIGLYDQLGRYLFANVTLRW